MHSVAFKFRARFTDQRLPSAFPPPKHHPSPYILHLSIWQAQSQTVETGDKTGRGDDGEGMGVSNDPNGFGTLGTVLGHATLMKGRTARHSHGSAPQWPHHRG